MNCDPLARSYRWLEYFTYGRALERCRRTMLPHVAHARKALVIGDGDGRFLTTLVLCNQALALDAIDLSLKMIEVAGQRLDLSHCPNRSRIKLQHGDIRTAAPPGDCYDLIATHFFFDIFPTNELKCVIDRVAGWTARDALWIVSEFDLPNSGWKRAKAQLWLRTMYAFFRLTTNLRNQQLPCWRPLLREAGFIKQKQVRFNDGFIVSELWRRAPDEPDASSAQAA
jgi:SAM-dependent methyltransferase